MLRSRFSYVLPESLIAQYPTERRGDSRLLCLERETGNWTDSHFQRLAGFLRPGDLLVFNDTRVIPARLFGTKKTGGRVEILVERTLGTDRVLAQIRASKSPKPGTGILLEGGEAVVVEGREEDLFLLKLPDVDAAGSVVEKYGHVPLPPYIQRRDEAIDRERYQTVYARQPGAVAAPTAGLHFTETMFEELASNGVDTGFLTLHVGAGTFQPVRVEQIEQHTMHSEWFCIDEKLCEKIRRSKQQGGRVIAVGTTVVRCLESAFAKGEVSAMRGETDIFIYPGYEFQVIDGLITNFHLPESTLLILVCAFAGTDNMLRAYAHAVAERYRFFSYGDAMFITPAKS